MAATKLEEEIRALICTNVDADGATEIAPFDFHKSYGYLVNYLSRMVTVEYLDGIKEHGVATAQAYVLGELWNEQPLSQVELARRLEIGKATIGQTLKRLEKAGLIQRSKVGSDKRVLMVELTKRGHDIRLPLHKAAWAQISQLRDSFGEEKLVKLTVLMAEMAEHLREHDPRNQS